jgi:putative DNA primase/helicase
MAKIPEKTMIAATRTGWTKDGNAYVFHDKVIGDENVFFQSESLSTDGAAKTGGNYHQWQEMAALCDGNPVLTLSLAEQAVQELHIDGDWHYFQLVSAVLARRWQRAAN